MLLRQINDPRLAQYAYLIGCQRTGEALVIDPERDVDRYLELAAAEDLRITAVTETHIHADFLSGARELAERVGAKLYLSDEGDADWKYGWLDDGDYDVTLLRHGDSFSIGKIELRVLHTPGHTPEHLSFLVVDHGGGMEEPIGLLSGDFVFVGDLGRPDLLESAAGVAGAMEPSARRLYESVQGFLELPDFVQVWPAHGAGSACGKALGAVPISTVGYERRSNAAIDVASRGEEPFVRSILEGQPEPPLYFARMKKLNRDGVPLLGRLPEPRALAFAELAAASRAEGAVVLDTRTDRSAFMAGHLPGSLHAPLDKTLPTLAGSYVLPEETIYLVAEPDEVEEAVRSLVRIGLDRIEGYAPPAALAGAAGLARTETIDFATAERLRTREEEPVLPLDVRGAAEYAAGHLPDALNIAHTRLLDRLDEVPREAELAVYCRTGSRAAAASSLLERHGFRVRYVDDKIDAWKRAREAAAASAS